MESFFRFSEDEQYTGAQAHVATAVGERGNFAIALITKNVCLYKDPCYYRNLSPFMTIVL
jgi:hypothetical protein